MNDYPPSCWDKIPHFKGCEEASKRLARLSEFKRAQVDTIRVIGLVFNSVAADPYVFEPPGSGNISRVRGTDPDPAPDPSIIKQK